MSEVLLSKATKEQLLAQAKIMNLEANPKWSADELRAFVAENGCPETIKAGPRIPLMTPNEDVDGGKDLTGGRISKEEAEDDKRAGYSKVWITVSRQEGEQSRVPLTCNGDTMLVPRGEKVRVPRKYFQILENAKRMDFASGSEPGDSALQFSAESPRFSYVVHSTE